VLPTCCRVRTVRAANPLFLIQPSLTSALSLRVVLFLTSILVVRFFNFVSLNVGSSYLVLCRHNVSAFIPQKLGSLFLQGSLFDKHGSAFDSARRFFKERQKILWHTDQLLCNDCDMGGYTRTVCGQRLGNHVPGATDTNATIEELCFLCGPCRDVISKGQGQSLIL
jgi:hypothetical protein